jgi:hypothetical protein
MIPHHCKHATIVCCACSCALCVQLCIVRAVVHCALCTCIGQQGLSAHLPTPWLVDNACACLRNISLPGFGAGACIYLCITGIGQNRTFTPCMKSYLIKYLQKLPCIHRIHVVLANPTNSQAATHLQARTVHIPVGTCWLF